MDSKHIYIPYKKRRGGLGRQKWEYLHWLIRSLGLTCKAVSGGPVEREKDDSWLFPRRRPAVRQKKRMVACMIKEVIRLVMSKHFYSFNNGLFRQTDGAGIGNAASEKLGKLLLKRFNRQSMKALKKNKVEVDTYGRFVDDVMTALASLDPGVRFVEGKLTFSQDCVEEESELPGDVNTFSELVKIADSIYKCVQFTSECPSSHEEGKVPVLDLQLFVGEEGTRLHEFYEKPVTCPFVIPEKSAHSKRRKIAVMVDDRKLRRSGYAHIQFLASGHQVRPGYVEKDVQGGR